MANRWGKAGVRLTDEEVRQRSAAAGARRLKQQQSERADDEVALRLWAAGMVRPYMITLALDSRGLEGPEVDEACGAKEPDVDLWEAGKLYPTWEQLKLLAKLTGTTVRFLCQDHPAVPMMATSMRFHFPAHERHDPDPVRVFDREAVAATVGSAGVLR